MKPLSKLGNLYMTHPPVKDGPEGSLVRCTGSTTRSAFWAGYDGQKGGLWPPQAASLAREAYDAGVCYRHSAERGMLPALPAE